MPGDDAKIFCCRYRVLFCCGPTGDTGRRDVAFFSDLLSGVGLSAEQLKQVLSDDLLKLFLIVQSFFLFHGAFLPMPTIIANVIQKKKQFRLINEWIFSRIVK